MELREIVVLILAVSVLFVGCISQSSTQIPYSTPQTTSSTIQASSSDGVLLLGRSVSYGWAEYMGLQWQEDERYCGTYQGQYICRFEVDSPPAIADSAIAASNRFKSPIVFFKLCFADFGESSEQTIEDEGYVKRVYDEIVTHQGRKLIVGNALPQVSRDTTPELKQQHLAYNQWLNQFAATHPNIKVIDLYGMLIDQNGALRSEYAMSSEDSHLNSNGYARITPKFMETISQLN